MTTQAVDVPLWQTARELAGALGYRVLIKVEEESTVLDVGYVATCKLIPGAPRAKAACARQSADAIEATVRFKDRVDSREAVTDAMHAALELAKDAS